VAAVNPFQVEVQTTFEEMSEFYLFPHEYLCLVANSVDRQKFLKSLPKPNFHCRKKAVNPGQGGQIIPRAQDPTAKRYLYDMSQQEVEGEYRP
jgi:hypothetical protein